MKIAFLLILWSRMMYADNKHNWEPRISLPGQCGPLEYYSECGSSCKTTCYTVQISVPCINKECIQGCYCKGGFLRKSKDAQCVKEHVCPKFRRDTSKLAQKEKELNELIETMLIGEK